MTEALGPNEAVLVEWAGETYERHRPLRLLLTDADRFLVLDENGEAVVAEGPGDRERIHPVPEEQREDWTLIRVRPKSGAKPVLLWCRPEGVWTLREWSFFLPVFVPELRLADLATLESAPSLAFGPVGIAAVRPPHVLAYQRLLREPPPFDDPIRRSFVRATTPAGRVLLAMLLRWEHSYDGLLNLESDHRPVTVAEGCSVRQTTVAEFVRPMLERIASYGTPPVPRPAGAERVLARRFGRALRTLREAAGLTRPAYAEVAGFPEGDVAAWEAGRGGLPERDVTDRLERPLLERVLFAPGLLHFATRRAVDITPERHPTPQDYDAMCPEAQRIMDRATLADVPVVGAGMGYPGNRSVWLQRPLEPRDLPPGVEFHDVRDPHYWHSDYQCLEHDHVVICGFGR